MDFAKPAKTPKEHVELWKSRGLYVADENEAEHYLRFIGYYRLGGYCLPFQKKRDTHEHSFEKGVTFSDILALYTFDRELRLLCMDAIERVEVAFRTALSNFMCCTYGPHWFMDKRRFRDGDWFRAFIQTVAEKTGFQGEGVKAKREPEHFIASYFRKYSHPKLPPSWMITEVLSLGDWSNVYENLGKREDKKEIAGEFKLPAEVCESWIRSVSYVRNLCAHHSRLWNRESTIRPLIASKFRDQLTPNTRFSAQAFVINYFMLRISPNTTWARRLSGHLRQSTVCKIADMGFKIGWESDPAWGISSECCAFTASN